MTYLPYFFVLRIRSLLGCTRTSITPSFAFLLFSMLNFGLLLGCSPSESPHGDSQDSVLNAESETVPSKQSKLPLNETARAELIQSLATCAPSEVLVVCRKISHSGVTIEELDVASETWSGEAKTIKERLPKMAIFLGAKDRKVLDYMELERKLMSAATHAELAKALIQADKAGFSSEDTLVLAILPKQRVTLPLMCGKERIRGKVRMVEGMGAEAGMIFSHGYYDRIWQGVWDKNRPLPLDIDEERRFEAYRLTLHSPEQTRTTVYVALKGNFVNEAFGER